jgi:hypothetical protein
MPLPITQIRIVNISDKTQEVIDSQLPNGRVYVDSHKLCYLPYQVYVRTWRRYEAWMRDIDKPNNKCFLDLVIADNPVDDIVCPHCNRRYHESEEEKDLRLGFEKQTPTRVRENELLRRAESVLEELSVEQYLKSLGQDTIDAAGDMSINDFLREAKRKEILDSKKKDIETNIEASEPTLTLKAK